MKRCPDCEQQKDFSEFGKDSCRKDGYRIYCKDCHNRQKREQSKKPEEKFKKKIRDAKYQKAREKSDPIYKARNDARRRIHKAVKHGKPKTFNKFVGCTNEKLRNKLESTFSVGMTWENRREWHIDHIIPLKKANTLKEIKKLCHYTNLQALWAADNKKKGAT